MVTCSDNRVNSSSEVCRPFKVAIITSRSLTISHDNNLRNMMSCSCNGTWHILSDNTSCKIMFGINFSPEIIGIFSEFHIDFGHFTMLLCLDPEIVSVITPTMSVDTNVQVTILFTSKEWPGFNHCIFQMESMDITIEIHAEFTWTTFQSEFEINIPFIIHDCLLHNPNIGPCSSIITSFVGITHSLVISWSVFRTCLAQ